MLTLLGTIVNLLTVPRIRCSGGCPQPPFSRRLGAAAATPRLVSVIIPARNEERAIERTVRALLAQTYPHLEVIVVDDRSTDATRAILESIKDDRLIVVAGEETPDGWLGKPYALHQGSLRARGELLLFMDADVIYAPEAIAAIVALQQESGASLVAYLPRFEMHGFWEHIGMPQLPMTLFSFIPLWYLNRSRVPFFALGGGPGNLVTRAAYDAAGGHEALKGAVVDDIGLARLIRRAGFPTIMALADELVSIRMYHGGREIIDGFTKNLFPSLHRSYAAMAGMIVFGFIVHLLPYGLALTGNGIAIATVVTISLTRLILFMALRYRVDNALFGHPLMLLLWAWIALRSTWITGVQRRLHWRGRTYDTKRTRFGP